MKILIQGSGKVPSFFFFVLESGTQGRVGCKQTRFNAVVYGHY